MTISIRDITPALDKAKLKTVLIAASRVGLDPELNPGSGPVARIEYEEGYEIAPGEFVPCRTRAIYITGPEFTGFIQWLSGKPPAMLLADLEAKLAERIS